MSVFFEVVLFWLAIAAFVLIILIVVLYCTFAYVDSYGLYSTEIRYNNDKDAIYQQLIEDCFEYSTLSINPPLSPDDDDETFWRFVVENRQQANVLLNEAKDHLEARRLLEINGRLILERNKRKRTCESGDALKTAPRVTVDADIRGMIVAEAFVILPKLLSASFEAGNQHFTVYTGLSDSDDNAADDNAMGFYQKQSVDTPVTPLRQNIGFWLNLKGYQYKEFETGKLEIVLKNIYAPRYAKKLN